MHGGSVLRIPLGRNFYTLIQNKNTETNVTRMGIEHNLFLYFFFAFFIPWAQAIRIGLMATTKTPSDGGAKSISLKQKKNAGEIKSKQIIITIKAKIIEINMEIEKNESRRGVREEIHRNTFVAISQHTLCWRSHFFFVRI